MIIEQISDLHFGILDNDEELYKEIHDGFINHCNKVHPDLIVVCGDCYDKRVLVNSTANIYLNKVVDEMISTGATIVIFEGTDSHDRHQIEAFSHYASEKFFLFNTVAKLNVLGLKLLILPEEYVKDVHYYDNYFNDKYDFIFGHGLNKHVSFGADNEYGEYCRKPFVFDYSMFKDICKYYVGFGHIHTHNVYKNIIYGGSYGRFNFGEEEPKGWIEYNLDKSKGKCSWKFLENKEAQTFRSELSSKLPNDIDNLLKQLRNYSEMNDYFRIIIDSDITDDKYNTIVGFVKTHKNCVIKRNMKSIEENKNLEIANNIKEKQEILINKMKDYKGLSLIEITQKIAKDEYHEDFSEEYINKILNTKL